MPHLVEPVPAAPPVDQPTSTATAKPRGFLHRHIIAISAAAVALGVLLLVGMRLLVTSTTVMATLLVTRGDIAATVVAAGVMQPFAYVDVGAQTSGKLKSLKVKRGDQVVADQLLAEIDPVLANSALTAATATLGSMTAQRALKQAQLALATIQLERSRTLLAELVIPVSDRDIAQATYDVAKADVASQSAEMEQAEAAVETAKANLGYTRITAPMAGEIVSISILEGQTINASQLAPNILRIADISTMTIWAQVSEADIVRIKPDQEAWFTILGSDRKWTGKTRQILPTPELINSVVFYDVLLDVPNTERILKIQMTAQAFIIMAQASGALLLSNAAIGGASDATTATVQVVGADGKVAPRAITIGVRSEISAQVLSGLSEGEKVLIRSVTTVAAAKSSLLGSRPGP